MRPDKLVLRNIGPFLGTHTVDFTELGSIFLVYGKTGAGKTTIFDALSYAFYGDAPGGRKGLARQMRSHFASDSDESAVVLEFTLGGNRWRIRRTLPVDRIGSRSGKLQTIPEEASLDLFESGDWRSRSSTNKSETDRKILDLIGLSEAEFSRIVLLPQGEFAQFLKQNSTERKEVLAKLFPVDRYTRVTALARDRARDETARLKDTHDAITALSRDFNRLAYDTDRASGAAETARLREAQTALRRELGEKAALLEQARAVSEKKQRLAALVARLDELERMLPEINRLKEEIAAARRADPLAVRHGQIELANGHAGELAKNIDSIRVELAERSLALGTLETESPRMAEFQREKEALLLRKEQLRIAVDIAGSLETEKTVFAETHEKLAERKKSLAGLKTESDACGTRLVELEKEISLLDERTKEHSRAHAALEKFKQLKILADDHERDKRAFAAHSGALSNTRAEIGINRRDSEIAAAQLAALETEKKRADTGELAASLAALLENGKPCPVCGSTEHPAPAATEASGFDLAERIAAGKRHTEQLAAYGENLGKKLAGYEAELRNAEERLALTLEKYRGAEPDCVESDAIPSPDEATARVKTASLVIQEATDALTRSQKALRESIELRRSQAGLDERRTVLSGEIDALKTAAAGQKTGIALKEARYREAFPAPESGSGTNPDAGVFPDPSDAADAFEEVSSRILGIEAAIGNHDAALKEERQAHAALSGKKNEMERTLTASSARLESERTAFLIECAGAGFADGGAVLAASRTPEEKKLAEEKISTFGEELTGSTKRRVDLENELSLWKGPDPETATADIEALDARVMETDRALEERSAALSALDALKNRWDELERERAERTAASGMLSSLAADLTGSNPGFSACTSRRSPLTRTPASSA